MSETQKKQYVCIWLLSNNFKFSGHIESEDEIYITILDYKKNKILQFPKAHCVIERDSQDILNE